MQLFPGIENDFFRNRLTHSMEVAQIAAMLATKINYEFAGFRGDGRRAVDVNIVETAGLAHDLGHPPFGHTGEEELDICMREFGGFEGNAQTLRLLTRLEKKGQARNAFSNGEDCRVGLNLTARVVAATLKYDYEIPLENAKRKRPNVVCKGYYKSEGKIVAWVKSRVLRAPRRWHLGNEEFKSLECQIMDIADDIAYSTYDLEDALKGGIIGSQDFVRATEDLELLERIAEKVRKCGESELDSVSAGDIREVLIAFTDAFLLGDFEALFSKRGNQFRPVAALLEHCERLARDGYYRSKFTSELVKSAVMGLEARFNDDEPSQSTARLEPASRLFVETLKHYTFLKVIMSPRMRVVNYRGQQIVRELFEALAKPDGFQLMPSDFRAAFESAPDSEECRKRVVCDFIAGMTDRYAVEFLARLKSENPQTIFKPF